MGFSPAGRGPFQAEINITPMIDVLLVLIIVFMVVNASLRPKGLDAQIPQEQQKDSVPEAERTIVIQVEGDGKDEPPSLKINQDPVPWKDLKTRLLEVYKTRAERVAFVRGDDEVNFQYVADVIDIARDAGVLRVGLLPTEMARAR